MRNEMKERVEDSKKKRGRTSMRGARYMPRIMEISPTAISWLPSFAETSNMG